MSVHVCIGLKDHFCACAIGKNHTEREHRDAIAERDANSRVAVGRVGDNMGRA